MSEVDVPMPAVGTFRVASCGSLREDRVAAVPEYWLLLGEQAASASAGLLRAPGVRRDEA